MRTLSVCLALLLTFAAKQVIAQPAGDPVIGLTLAQDRCARCHDIAPGGAFKTMPPSFASIAAYRTADDITMRIWFPPLHASMPPGTMIFTAQEVADLTAYIVSLEGE